MQVRGGRERIKTLQYSQFTTHRQRATSGKGGKSFLKVSVGERWGGWGWCVYHYSETRMRSMFTCVAQSKIIKNELIEIVCRMENVLRIHVLSPSVLGYQAQMLTKIVFIIEHYDAFLSALKFTLMFPFFYVWKENKPF